MADADESSETSAKTPKLREFKGGQQFQSWKAELMTECARVNLAYITKNAAAQHIFGVYSKQDRSCDERNSRHAHWQQENSTRATSPVTVRLRKPATWTHTTSTSTSTSTRHGEVKIGRECPPLYHWPGQCTTSSTPCKSPPIPKFPTQ
eukprot:139976-Rhodomonas_salina.3